MESWLGAALAGAAAGALGAMGLGGGGVLLLWLALSGVEQLAAQGINLTFFLPVGAVGVWMHWRAGLIQPRAALPMAAGGLIGLAAGVALAGRLPGALLSKLFGALVAALAVREGAGAARLFREKKGGGPGRSSGDSTA